MMILTKVHINELKHSLKALSGGQIDYLIELAGQHDWRSKIHDTEITEEQYEYLLWLGYPFRSRASIRGRVSESGWAHIKPRAEIPFKHKPKIAIELKHSMYGGEFL